MPKIEHLIGNVYSLHLTSKQRAFKKVRTLRKSGCKSHKEWIMDYEVEKKIMGVGTNDWQWKVKEWSQFTSLSSALTQKAHYAQTDEDLAVDNLQALKYFCLHNNTLKSLWPCLFGM